MQAIRYPTGKTDSIEVAVRRAAVTGVNQTALRLQEERAAQMGSDLAETTAHAGARPTHQIWQGKVFSLSGRNKKYPDFKSSTGYGTGAGLGGWNCRHSWFPFFEGISEGAYTDQELESYNAKDIEYNGVKMTEYEASQRQRGIERKIRRWKREKEAMKAAGLSTEEASVKIKSWQEVEKDFIKQTGLKKQTGRSQVGTYGKAEARKTTAEAEKYYRTWINSVSNEGTPKRLAGYYDMKYNRPKEYELLKGYVKAVEKGDINALTGFKVYLDTAKEIETKLIGLNVGGIEIKDYVPHFVDRVIGTHTDYLTPVMSAELKASSYRKGVSIDDIKNALVNPLEVGDVTIRENGKKSISFMTNRVKVSINPNTGELVQVNPYKS